MARRSKQASHLFRARAALEAKRQAAAPGDVHVLDSEKSHSSQEDGAKESDSREEDHDDCAQDPCQLEEDPLVYEVVAINMDSDDELDLWGDLDPWRDAAQPAVVSETTAAPSLGLSFSDNVGSLKKAWGCGEKTLQRERKRQKDTKDLVVQLRLKTLKDFWGQPIPVPKETPAVPIAGFDPTIVDVVLQTLHALLKTSKNKKESAKMLGDSVYDAFRLRSIEVYFKKIKDGEGRMDASFAAATVLGRGNYGARIVRQWANFYSKNLLLPTIEQGRHVKTKSLIHDEDVRSKCRAYLKALKPDERSINKFKTWIHEELVPTVLGQKRPKPYDDATIYRWLHVLGFKHRKVTKGIFIDGHEREDVVEYRSQFLERMAALRRRAVQYEDVVGVNGVATTKAVPPTLEPGETEVVFVYHDETCFAANDGLRCLWLEGGEKVLRPKGDGKSIMVSGFLCACHGLLTHKIITPGVNDDGWWRCEDLIEQVQNDALPMFDKLHPSKTGVFIFDNSMNHKKRPEDGLNAKAITLKDGGKNIPKDMRPGFYTSGDQCYAQRMQYEDGKPKGLLTILREREILGPAETIRWQCRKTPCTTEEPFACCAVNLLDHQPDFAAQKSMLEEVFESSCHLVDLLPKFHPEFNPIENFWGSAKAYCRQHCDYTFKSLHDTVPNALAQVALLHIQRFERRCHRYMQVYAAGLPPHLAEFAVKKYKSHRCIPSENLMEHMEAEFSAKKQ